MKIVDVTKDKKDLFCLCLEDWSDEAKESGPKRRQWFDHQEKLGLRAKLALNDNGVEGGMIQYGPIERSFVNGSGLYFIYCIWVHGHKQGRGDFRKHGMGSALLRAAEEDARALGAKGTGIVRPIVEASRSLSGSRSPMTPSPRAGSPRWTSGPSEWPAK